MKTPTPTINLVGHRYSRLMVKGFAYLKKENYYWHCVCDCGSCHIISAGHLRSGRTKSCGCLGREKSKTVSFIHGESRGNNKTTAEYRAYASMKSRCSNPAIKGWNNYGGIGVSVCNRWKESYQNFLSDMGRKPTSQHSLDRYPDPYGNYEPSNCRWATAKQQASNKRNNTPRKTQIGEHQNG